MIAEVYISKQASKDLRSVPHFIARKFRIWVRSVQRVGLEEVRKTPGYHDEPLKGDRSGQRSIRLSASYRAIYTIDASGILEVVVVKEVNNHDY